MKGRQVDLSSGGEDENQRSSAARDATSAPRRFLGVHFVCCDVYTRIYLNRNETGYNGNCPKCGKRVRFRLGSDGTSARFFTAR